MYYQDTLVLQISAVQNSISVVQKYSPLRAAGSFFWASRSRNLICNYQKFPQASSSLTKIINGTSIKRLFWGHRCILPLYSNLKWINKFLFVFESGLHKPYWADQHICWKTIWHKAKHFFQDKELFLLTLNTIEWESKVYKEQEL